MSRLRRVLTRVVFAAFLFVGSEAANAAAPPDVRDSLSGRSGPLRARLLKKYGGNEHSERAVALALDWLAKQQQADGSWSLSGPYTDGVQPAEPAAATAMALLAFLGSGITHREGAHKTVVATGLKWLTDKQQGNGSWRADSGHHRMYLHGFALAALCEAYGMTKDAELRKVAENAVKYALDTQSRAGGWRYNPSDQDQDVSVTGVMFMGLQTARMAGLKVPQENLDKVGEFLDKCTKDGSRYSYLAESSQKLPAMTAEALLCRQHLGWKPDEEKMRKGVEYLLNDHPPAWRRWDDFDSTGRDVYYWYFGTQLMFQMEGEAWERWNAATRDALVKNQVSSGKEKGSWPASGDKWGPYGGGLYVTCMHTYMLQVYYRHLPLFSIRP